MLAKWEGYDTMCYNQTNERRKVKLNSEVTRTFRGLPGARLDLEKDVVFPICQSLCPHFKSPDWRGCSPCPINGLRNISDDKTMGTMGWLILLPKALSQVELHLFPGTGVVRVVKELGDGNTQQIGTNGISAFRILFQAGITQITFLNPQKRPLLRVNEYGEIAAY